MPPLTLATLRVLVELLLTLLMALRFQVKRIVIAKSSTKGFGFLAAAKGGRRKVAIPLDSSPTFVAVNRGYQSAKFTWPGDRSEWFNFL